MAKAPEICIPAAAQYIVSVNVAGDGRAMSHEENDSDRFR
jgi:hypothetical protein